MTHHQIPNKRNQPKSEHLKEIINELYEAIGHSVALDYEDKRYINIMGSVKWVDETNNQTYLRKVTTGKGKHLDEFYANINLISRVTYLKEIEEYDNNQQYTDGQDHQNP